MSARPLCATISIQAEQAEWATLAGDTAGAVAAPDPVADLAAAPAVADVATAAVPPGGGSGGSTSIAVKWGEAEFLAPAGVKVPKTDNFVDEDSEEEGSDVDDVVNTDGAVNGAQTEAAAAAAVLWTSA